MSNFTKKERETVKQKIIEMVETIDNDNVIRAISFVLGDYIFSDIEKNEEEKDKRASYFAGVESEKMKATYDVTEKLYDISIKADRQRALAMTLHDDYFSMKPSREEIDYDIVIEKFDIISQLFSMMLELACNLCKDIESLEDNIEVFKGGVDG